MAHAQAHAGLLLLLSFLIAWHRVAASGLSCQTPAADVEDFSEELLLRPLPDGKVLAHFFFASYSPPVVSYGNHHTIFSKAIFQLVQKFRIREMELSFTQGRWNSQRWGSADAIPSSNAKPKGVELWAVFGVPDEEVDRAWGELTNALSGLFSSSINFLDSTTTYAAPGPAFRPDLAPLRGFKVGINASRYECGKEGTSSTAEKSTGNSMRYGALPREAACTENLTPWLKLLPCRDKAGLATLMDRPSIYRGFYHSLKVHVRSGDFGMAEGLPTGTVLEQSLTLVMWPSKGGETRVTKLRHTVQPSWSLKSLFGAGITGSCPIASSSHVYLEFGDTLLDSLRTHGSTGPEPDANDVVDGVELKGSWERELLHNDAVVLRAPPDTVLRGRHERSSQDSALLVYDVSKGKGTVPLNVELLWKAPVVWSAHHGPFRATRFLTGSGNQKGSVVIKLLANAGAGRSLAGKRDMHATDLQEQGSTHVSIFQMFPWYIHLYWHTSTVTVDGQQVPLLDIAKSVRLSPSEFRKYPTVIEMELELPSNATDISISVEFDKGFLRIDEHPPDANRGFDLPSALITFPDIRTGTEYDKGCTPLLQTFEAGQPVQIYTESLVVPLATPDFSMPYNVTTMTCTVLALYFGSVLNVLRRRLGEEERKEAKLAKAKAAREERKKQRLNVNDELPSWRSKLKFLVLLLVISIAIKMQFF